MADSSQVVQPTPNPPKRQGRSPAYPAIPLGKALERAEALRVAEGGRPKHYVPRAAICSAWGLGLKTGPAKQAIAALGYFGLFEFEGTGENRGARLTEVALKILLDKQPVSPERDKFIEEVALAPVIHKELWGKWRADLPSDPTLETFLVRDRGFSEVGARELMTQYRDTLTFAKLMEPATLSAQNGEPSPPKPGASPMTPQVNPKPGADQFVPPRILMNGNRLDIQASVDLAGLRQLKEMLTKFEGILEMMEPKKNEAAN